MKDLSLAAFLGLGLALATLVVVVTGAALFVRSSRAPVDPCVTVGYHYESDHPPRPALSVREGGFHTDSGRPLVFVDGGWR